MEGKLQFDVPIHIAFDHPELRRIPASSAIAHWGSRADWIKSGMKKTAAQLVAERLR
jgi:hypothetical protein